LHGVLYALVPGLEKARAPIMAMAIADVAVAALAALGVQALLRHSVARLDLLRNAALATGAALFVVSLYPPRLVSGTPDGAEHVAGTAVVAMLLG
jgi:hypothetical protein